MKTPLPVDLLKGALLIILFICADNAILAQDTQREIDSLFNQRLNSMWLVNDSIVQANLNPDLESDQAKLAALRGAFNKWQKDYFDAQKMKSDNIFNESEGFFFDNIFDSENRSNKILKDRDLLKISQPIMVDSLEVEVEFGNSRDGESADQEVVYLMITSLKEALSKANKALIEQDVPPINNIYIFCTTNGKHSKYSNHSKKEAVDISRLNGYRMIDIYFSMRLNRSLAEIYGQDFLTSEITAKEEFNELVADLGYNYDIAFLYPQIVELQRALQSIERRREHFGPIVKTKYSKDKKRNKNNLDMNRVKGHLDHIHFSVR